MPKYLHYDVFTSVPFEGNQLAVFPQPSPDWQTTEMQRIAAEMAFSETTFVFPATGAGDVRMRIFTPASELPMAGHPTIGSTFALAREGVIEPGRPEFVFELGVGPTPVALEWEDRGLSFAWMTQPRPSFGATVDDRAAFADAIGLARADLADLPIQVISCGVPFLFAPIATRAAVDRIGLDRRRIRRVLDEAGCDDLPIFFFTTDRGPAAGDETVYSRMLAPQFGIMEDPATGSASGPLGCYLLQHGVVDASAARALLSLQGVAMKRPSRISISIESAGGAITGVRVGGRSVLVAEGTLLAP